MQSRGGFMPRPMHFEISSQEPEQLLEFYTEVFGWTSQKWQGSFDYWFLMTGAEDEPGIDGAIVKSSQFKHTVNTIEVPDIDLFLSKITEHGGKILMSKTDIPNVGFHAYCADPEGNLFGLMQFHPRTNTPTSI
jgi:predicted enzyme related to lactoylglutathione lyase